MQMTTRTTVLLIICVVLGTYYPVIFSPFNSVDDPGVYTYLLNVNSFGIREMFSTAGSVHYYRPVYWLSYWADKYIWGLEESFMHLENMVFHLLNVLLVFAVAHRVFLLKNFRSHWPPLIAALIFALHPLNTEAVNWIVGRTDLLAALFLLFSTWLLLREKCHWGVVLLAATSLFVACLAKETAIFYLPAAVLLPFFLPAQTPSRPSIRYFLLSHWPLFIFFPVMGIGYFVFRHLMFVRGDAGVSHVVSRLTGGQGFGLFESAHLILKAAGFYLKKLFIPFPLNFGIIHVSDLYIPVGVFAVLLVFFCLKRRTLTTYFFFSAATIGSSALLVPLLEATWTPLAERYMYIPSAFFVVGVVLLTTPWAVRLPRPHILVLSIGVLLCGFAYATETRTLLWQSNLALFQDTLNKSPYFTPAKIHLALAMQEQGLDISGKDGLVSLRGAHPLGSSPSVLMDQATALFQQGKIHAARGLLQRALKNPGRYEQQILKHFLSQYDQLIMRLDSGQELILPETVPLLIRLYELSDDPFYLYRLGQAYLFLNDKEHAQEAFGRAAAQTVPTAYYYKAALKLSKELGRGTENKKGSR